MPGQLQPGQRTFLHLTALTDIRELLHAHCRCAKEGAGAVWSTSRAVRGSLARWTSLCRACGAKSCIWAGGRLWARGAALASADPVVGPLGAPRSAALGAEADRAFLHLGPVRCICISGMCEWAIFTRVLGPMLNTCA